MWKKDRRSWFLFQYPLVIEKTEIWHRKDFELN